MTDFSHEHYLTTLDEKLHDKQMRDNLHSAMSTLRAGRKRLVENNFNDWEHLRTKASAVKDKCLGKLDVLIEKFATNCANNGMQVHFAKDAAEANEIIYKIAKDNEADLILKGKSMASEEIGLNHFLKEKGIFASETDLGEIIIQFIDEPPVHIVVPAIHKNRKQVGEIFHKHIEGAPLETEIPKLNAIARGYLRKKFEGFKIGLSGVNFGIADEGAIWLIENEGNGRMSTTACDVHVAICGIEKIVESFEDAAILNTMLAPSAVGAMITAYNNIIKGPRQAGELDGPKQMHIVLLDNHRSTMLATKDFHKALSCIRCGTCLNHCPVYEKVGGHSYIATYPGPIGEVISPQIFGLDKVGYIDDLCSLCGRCSQVCPVKIPLSQLIRKMRAEQAFEGRNKIAGDENIQRHKGMDMAMRGFATVASSPKLWHMMLWCAGTFKGLLEKYATKAPVLRDWTSCRSFPQIETGLEDKLKNMEGVTCE